jgi:GPI ethanolamine phosphate transferase 1
MADRQRPQTHSPSASTRRRERWLVVLGVALHAVYMLSIFDIYFKSPIVHGMAPVPPRFSAPPAKRVVLVVGESPFVLLIDAGRVI